MESRKSFADLGLEDQILEGLSLLNFEYPTEIQEKSIPILLSGTEDLVAVAQTGTGKTAAFSLPIIQQIDISNNSPQAIILSPTRELGIQICRDIKSYTKKKKGITTLAVYGGTDIRSQIKSLERGVHLVVGTPGRTMDLIKRRKLKLGGIRWVVLDEADEMLSMGFKEDLTEILSHTPEDRQTVLFSATMPKDIRHIAKEYMKDPIEVATNPKQIGTKNVQHEYFVINPRQRYRALKRLVDFHPDIYGIIFCRTKRETQEVAIKLSGDGYSSDAIHGDLSQSQRDVVMKRFRTRQIQLLVATDVAARGIDVNDLTHVINFSLPDSLETYVHRSGRTGRANSKGQSLILVGDREAYRIRHLEKKISLEITRGKVPSGSQVNRRRVFQQVDKLENTIVNKEAEMENILEEVKNKLAWMTKDELIERWITSEFAESIKGFADDDDLNIQASKKDGRRKGRSHGDHDDNWGKFRVNVGHDDKIKPAELITLINQNTRGTTVPLGKISIESTFSVIEVGDSHLTGLLKAFKNVKFRGKKVDASRMQSYKRGKKRGFHRKKRRK